MEQGYGDIRLPEAALAVARSIMDICARAWTIRLLAGYSGNVSCLLPEAYEGGAAVLITGAGTPKGNLTEKDFALLDVASGTVLAGSGPSTETGMHLEIYRCCPETKAVMHTHPPHLLALSLALPFDDRLSLPLFEAGAYRKILGQAGTHDPGSAGLAGAVGSAARRFRAVWMEGHGLTVHGPSLRDCLAVSEEMDHLAKIRLLRDRAIG